LQVPEVSAPPNRYRRAWRELVLAPVGAGTSRRRVGDAAAVVVAVAASGVLGWLDQALAAILARSLFRGVAFEFRFKSDTGRRWWDRSFFAGSVVATFFQGVVLGEYVQGFAVSGRHFAGGSFDWVKPFPLATGAGLLFGYGLLGATWLVMKTEGPLQEKSRKQATACLLDELFVADHVQAHVSISLTAHREATSGPVPNP
jgi:cytochrome d ubiquinol oxidase subunit II